MLDLICLLSLLDPILAHIQVHNLVCLLYLHLSRLNAIIEVRFIIHSSEWAGSQNSHLFNILQKLNLLKMWKMWKCCVPCVWLTKKCDWDLCVVPNQSARDAGSVLSRNFHYIHIEPDDTFKLKEDRAINPTGNFKISLHVHLLALLTWWRSRDSYILYSRSAPLHLHLQAVECCQCGYILSTLSAAEAQRLALPENQKENSECRRRGLVECRECGIL